MCAGTSQNRLNKYSLNAQVNIEIHVLTQQRFQSASVPAFSSGLICIVCTQLCIFETYLKDNLMKQEFTAYFIQPAHEARGPEGPARWER